jgi:hypothetical protein
MEVMADVLAGWIQLNRWVWCFVAWVRPEDERADRIPTGVCFFFFGWFSAMLGGERPLQIPGANPGPVAPCDRSRFMTTVFVLALAFLLVYNPA